MVAGPEESSTDLTDGLTVLGAAGYHHSGIFNGDGVEREERMKLIVAIVQDHDASKAVDELIGHGFGATRINTAGGFLKRGNSTILTGVEDERANEVIQILRDTCHRTQAESNQRTSAGIIFVLPVSASYKM